MRQGIWATERGIDLQLVYQAANDSSHALSQPMFEDFRKSVLRYWPLEDLFDLGVAPTSYVDDSNAFAFLPTGLDDDPLKSDAPVLKSGLIIPMLWEDGAWKVNLPGWRLAWNQK